MNCVVICCDTFRADMIGHPVVKTPNLDCLVREGINFTGAFGEGLPTIQARRTLFTGIRSFPWRFEMGSRGLNPCIPGWHRIPDEQTTLSEFLLDNDVVTGFVADTYHMFKPTQNFTRGFASWTFIRGQERDPMRSGPKSAVDPTKHLPDGDYPEHWLQVLTQYLLNMLDRHTAEDYLPARVFRRASAWLEENVDNEPWFLWVDSFAPHERWDPPTEFADAYYVARNSKDYIQPQLINGMEPSEDEIERTRALYHGYVTFVDKWIGRFLDRMADLDLLDSTAIIFTSDHGTELWDKGRFGKGADKLHPYNTRLPLVVRMPGGKGGGTVRDDFAQHQDIFPTVCRIMGVEPADELELDGRDLFDSSAAAPGKVISAWGPNVSIRDKHWNLLMDSTLESDAKKLYDLEQDPTESTDVSQEHPNTVSELVGFMEDMLGKLPYEIRHHGDRRQAPPTIRRLWAR